MSHTGGHTALVGMTVMNGGHGEMKCLFVLPMIHNLQLQKASLIMTAVGKERVLWIAGEKKHPWVFSKFLLLAPEPLWSCTATSKPGAVGAAVQQLWDLPSRASSARTISSHSVRVWTEGPPLCPPVDSPNWREINCLPFSSALPGLFEAD